jgi:hypothetical protein
LANNLRLFGVGVVIAGEQAPARATELLVLDKELLTLDFELLELDFELLELDSELLELDFELLELDSELLELDFELLELDSELPELDFELLELDSELFELDFELLELDITLITLDAELLETASWLLEALATRLELALDCWALELAELVTTKIGSKLLETPADELFVLAIDEVGDGNSPACASSELAANEPVPALADELAATAVELAKLATAELAANGLEGELFVPAPPAPPPQAFKKATAKHPKLNLSTRVDLEGCM